MSDTEDDFLDADNGIDEGYGWCPHVNDYGWRRGNKCLGDDVDSVQDLPQIDGSGNDYAEQVADAVDATGYGLFQAVPGQFWMPGNPTPARAYCLTDEMIRSARKIDNPKEKYTMDVSGIARMRAELEAMLTKVTNMVAVVERFGGEPGDGTVIKFEHEFEVLGRSGETVYNYVAVRKFGKWYVSGRPFSGRAVKWAELLEFIGDGRAWICSEFTEVPMPGAMVAGSDEDTRARLAEVLNEMSGAELTAATARLLSTRPTPESTTD